MLSGPTLQDVNQMYSKYSDRYYSLLARGADRPDAGFAMELDLVRSELDALGGIIQRWTGTPERLGDVVTYTLHKKVKPILDKIDTKFPEGTMVVPGSSVDVPFRVPESLLPKKDPGEMEEESPIGYGQKHGKKLLEDTPWYYWAGIDMRVPGALAIGAFLIFALRSR